jgi:thioredoxin-related protein
MAGTVLAWLRQPLYAARCAAVAAAWGLSMAAAAAGIPPAYGAMVVEPAMLPASAGQPARAEFDLTAAQARAQRENKHLYVYLGAEDCPYCRRYEAFLAAHAGELVPHFKARYLVVDLRSSLSVQARSLYFKVGGTSRPYVEFMQALGDERARMLVYPSVWLLDGDLKPLMQMPAGTGTFQTVPEQLEILQLVQ